MSNLWKDYNQDWIVDYLYALSKYRYQFQM